VLLLTDVGKADRKVGGAESVLEVDRETSLGSKLTQ
jgi:hypothetical protein